MTLIGQYVFVTVGNEYVRKVIVTNANLESVLFQLSEGDNTFLTESESVDFLVGRIKKIIADKKNEIKALTESLDNIKVVTE